MMWDIKPPESTCFLNAPLLQINQKGEYSELQVVVELFLPGGDLDVCPKARSGQDPFVSQMVTVQMWHIEKLLLKSENYHYSKLIIKISTTPSLIFPSVL